MTRRRAVQLVGGSFRSHDITCGPQVLPIPFVPATDKRPRGGFPFLNLKKRTYVLSSSDSARLRSPPLNFAPRSVSCGAPMRTADVFQLGMNRRQSTIVRPVFVPLSYRGTNAARAKACVLRQSCPSEIANPQSQIRPFARAVPLCPSCSVLCSPRTEPHLNHARNEGKPGPTWGRLNG